ncbi:hypothetical protein HAZT_HAZT011844 [Hyalella azteca]|uniref:RRM domain-containing protein n=1 Tax=Hyalella azteca TaxID=294128 RepID=A0A6A0GSG1_HYAAZ|nr:hypothetical protein HAZT_HAZT011844 [Hyalella azteca]
MAESISVIGGGHPVRRDENKKNNRLFVGSLDRTKTDVDVSRAMKELVDGVISVIMYPSPQEKTQNRGYAFVEFDSHENAVKAREYLRNNPPKLWGVSQIKVDWAEPENEVDAETMSKVKVLFVRQLAQSTSEEKLRKVFERFGALDRVKRQHDHAFIHFNEREHAAEALKQTNSE